MNLTHPWRFRLKRSRRQFAVLGKPRSPASRTLELIQGRGEFRASEELFA